ncbi:hypothetical protein ARMSODRAFT_956920 [Armillaria solidipes]|uniref:Uncharacterized protein n=1 Tax=Armillaria solidipes TaxID=1076256 RepID=A0A2H3BKB3_9AGAR|nr:hypothetical protein ARMSODRAFT_956920 [Armillaria solidipes]
MMRARCSDSGGAERTCFQIIRNRHEVNILGPPLPNNKRDGCSIQLELIFWNLEAIQFLDEELGKSYAHDDCLRSQTFPSICGAG